jgi:hypothetical protein
MRPLMPAFLSWAVAGCAVALGALLIRQLVVTMRLGRRNAALERALRERDEEAEHLLTTRLPPLADTVYHRPARIPGLLHDRLAGTAYAHHLESVMLLFADVGKLALTQADKSAQAALRAVMKSVQSLAKEQQLAISTMQHEHDDPDVFAGLLEVDHANAQLSRRAQAVAVLCGSWVGQQRSAAALAEIVRGATSRIRHYLRVHCPREAETAVVSGAVEPVVLALAELLDYATRYSPPTTSVEVNFEEPHHGVAVTIDDAGVGMDADATRRAMDLLNPKRRSVDIAALGDPPQVGFAVIGVLAVRYGFSVSVDTVSPYGGVRAVLFLPSALLTRPQTARTDAAGAAATTSSAPEENRQASQPSTVSGLPKRGRRGAPAQPRSAAQPPDGPQRSAERTAAGLAAWQRGSRTGRGTGTSDSEGNSPA